ncbi:MAG: serine hydrolase [Treponema sp.]|nr:serine hydrolase [Treponema sp.]
MNFDGFIGDIETNKWQVFGVEVYKDNRLLASYGDCDKNLHEIYSATKTVLSLAVGIACDEGLFDIQRCLLDYMPAERLAKLSGEEKSTFEQITIERLLTMSVEGFPFRASGDSWLDFSLSCKIKNPAQKIFSYSNISAYLVGVALAEALKRGVWRTCSKNESRSSDKEICNRPASSKSQSQENSILFNYIEEKLLSPLGISRYQYQLCPDGYFYGASGMKLTVHDLSKFGLLLYKKGNFEDQRIVSEEYIKAATSIQQENREGGYGYFIWKYREGFSINGKWKQKCYVLPNRELIISFLSHIEDGTVPLIESMEKHLLGL